MSQKQEEYDKAMDELNEIEKSVHAGEESELDALTKSLEEEFGEDLSKAEDEEGEDETKGTDEGVDDDLGKSDDTSFDDELVKASEAYADLEKSVVRGFGVIADQIDTLSKSLAANMNLNIKMAKVIAELSKSRKEDVEALTEISKSIGATPVAPGKAVLGLGGNQDPIKKSVSEITMDLTKAVQDGRVEARFLSIYGTHKDADRLPESVRKEIGL